MGLKIGNEERKYINKSFWEKQQKKGVKKKDHAQSSLRSFKCSYQPQQFWLPKLDAGGVLIGGHDYKWLSSFFTTYSRVDYPSWTMEGRQLGFMTTNDLQVFLPLAAVPVTQAGHWRGISWESWLQMAFRSSYHLQPCRLLKLDAGATSVVGHHYKWPSSFLTIWNCAGYPSWTLEWRQLRVTTTNGLQVFPPFAAVLVTQVGRWRGVSWGSRLQDGLQRIPRGVAKPQGIPQLIL